MKSNSKNNDDINVTLNKKSKNNKKQNNYKMFPLSFYKKISSESSLVSDSANSIKASPNSVANYDQNQVNDVSQQHDMSQIKNYTLADDLTFDNILPNYLGNETNNLGETNSQLINQSRAEKKVLVKAQKQVKSKQQVTNNQMGTIMHGVETDNNFINVEANTFEDVDNFTQQNQNYGNKSNNYNSGQNTEYNQNQGVNSIGEERLKEFESQSKYSSIQTQNAKLSKAAFKRQLSLNKNQQLLQDPLDQKHSFCSHSFILHPNSSFKIKWDIFVIILSLYNAVIVPLEFTFPQGVDSRYFKIADYTIDALFLFDIVLNFRTSYMDPKSEQIVTNQRKIAFNYVIKGRFWLDLSASLPFDEIYTIFSADTKLNRKNLKFISMLKLVRILRLGRMITYLKMNQNFKFGIKFVQLGLMLLLVLHWTSCIWFYLVQVNKMWYPPKDSGLDATMIYHVDEAIWSIYGLIMYYSMLTIMGNDILPQTNLELGVAIIIVLIGTIILSTIIGEFSKVLSNISQKANQINEELDMIQNIMAALKIPENIQNNVYEYYELRNNSKFVKNDQFYLMMTDTLKSTVKLFQSEQAIRRMRLFDTNNLNQIENFANLLRIAIFLPNDVIIKQGDVGESFYLIIDGIVEVCHEKRDFLFFDKNVTSRFIGDNKQWLNSYKERDLNTQQIFIDMFKNRTKNSIQRRSSKSSTNSQLVNRRQALTLQKDQSKQALGGKQKRKQLTEAQQKQNIASQRRKSLAAFQLRPVQIQSSSVSDINHTLQNDNATSQRGIMGNNSITSINNDTSATDSHSNRYTIINEINTGEYFGEISLITNIKRTCSVYSINKLICGIINKRDFISLIQQNTDFKNKLLDKVDSYKDFYMKFLRNMIRNVGAFKGLSKTQVQSILFKLSERRYLAGQAILNIGQKSDQCYFLTRGKIGVHVFANDLDEMYQLESKQLNQHLKLFCTLNEGSHFNFTHFQLNRPSLFVYKAEKDCSVMQLSFRQYHKLTLRSQTLSDIFSSVKALYDEEGSKYDFNRMHIKTDTTLGAKSQANSPNIVRQSVRKRSTSSLRQSNNNINSTSKVFFTGNVVSETTPRQKRINKFWILCKKLRRIGFRMNDLEIFGYVDNVYYEMMRKESVAKMTKATKIIEDNYQPLQSIEKISQYTKTAAYFTKYPQAEQISDYMSLSDKYESFRPTLEEQNIKKLLKDDLILEPSLKMLKGSKSKSYLLEANIETQKIEIDNRVIPSGQNQIDVTFSLDFGKQQKTKIKYRKIEPKQSIDIVDDCDLQNIQNTEYYNNEPHQQKQILISGIEALNLSEETPYLPDEDWNQIQALDENDYESMKELQKLNLNAHHNSNLIHLLYSQICTTTQSYQEQLAQLDKNSQRIIAPRLQYKQPIQITKESSINQQNKEIVPNSGNYQIYQTNKIEESISASEIAQRLGNKTLEYSGIINKEAKSTYSHNLENMSNLAYKIKATDEKNTSINQLANSDQRQLL